MLSKIFSTIIVAGIGYSAYKFYTGPYYDAPQVGQQDFLLVFKGEDGLKGVMRGFGDKDGSRQYMSYNANNVPRWYQKTWSVCRKPTDQEVTSFDSEAGIGPGGRLDAVCEIDADGDVFIRGWVASVPDL
ncbi:MAG: hypothetical protein V4712_16890 [Pseudomonadota bacterium]